MSTKSCSAQFIEGLPYHVWKMFFISARSKFPELLCDMCDGGLPVPSESLHFSNLSTQGEKPTS